MRISRGEALAAVGAVVVAALIGVTQPRAAANLQTVRNRTDVHALPPPEHLQRLAFGYRSALVDLLWAKVLVEQGLHWEEKRRFDELPSYLDGIVALEPKFKPLYEFVDTLILYQYIPGSDADAHRVRAYLEGGTKALPYDADVWLHYGQFIAFLAPSYLKDKAEIEQWRHDGALAISQAVDLGADADRSLAASTILSKSGETKASIRTLNRAYAMTSDPETRFQIRQKLLRLNATVDAEATVEELEGLWRSRYPFMSRGEVLMIGPTPDPAACAGPTSRAQPACAGSWAALDSP